MAREERFGSAFRSRSVRQRTQVLTCGGKKTGSRTALPSVILRLGLVFCFAFCGGFLRVAFRSLLLEGSEPHAIKIRVFVDPEDVLTAGLVKRGGERCGCVTRNSNTGGHGVAPQIRAVRHSRSGEGCDVLARGRKIAEGIVHRAGAGQDTLVGHRALPDRIVFVEAKPLEAEAIGSREVSDDNTRLWNQDADTEKVDIQIRNHGSPPPTSGLLGSMMLSAGSTA